MSYNQFKILVYIEKIKDNKITQRQLSKNLELSLGTINKVINELENLNYIDSDLSITSKGLLTLSPYKVKRAIFLAAGFGSRLMPITFNTPKPLVKVHGIKMIETLLDAVIKADIEEIIVVRGYLKDQFDVLLNKYPNIKFVDNDMYNEQNNISSAYLIRDYLENAYVLESDLFLYNQDLIQKYQYHSNYLGKFVKMTDDWCFDVKKGIVSNLRKGGIDCYQLYGISYYDSKTAKQLKKDLEYVYEKMPGGKDIFWDSVTFDYCKENYNIYQRDCSEGDIIEIDSYNELKEIDSIYNI